MKKIISAIIIFASLKMIAQTPSLPLEVPKRIPKKNELPIPKINPDISLKADLTADLISIDSVVYDKPSKTYKVFVQVTTSNNSSVRVRVGENATAQPKMTAHLLYFDGELDVSVTKTAKWDLPVPTLAANQSSTTQQKFYFTGLPTNSIITGKLHITVDWKYSVTEANEDNNSTESLDITFDPSIIGARNDHDHF